MFRGATLGGAVSTSQRLCVSVSAPVSQCLVGIVGIVGIILLLLLIP